jgi:ABC-type protease/lipase transport system fused ATPase/permease subunit
MSVPSPKPESALASALSSVRHAFVAVAGLSGLLNVLTLAGSFFMLLVYDRVLPSRSLPTLVGLVVLVGVIYIFQALLGCCQSNRNLSPVERSLPYPAVAQAMSDCHSARAAERRSL